MKKMKRILPIFLILFYVLLASVNLKYPAVQYDEILFGNAARGGYVDDTFIVKRLFGLPVFLMDYIGALKAYIYMPIFKIFGVSPYTIRFPAILLTALGLIFLYKFVDLFFNRKISVLALLLLVTHPDFIAFTRVDVGPSVLTFLFRCMALYYLSVWLKTRKNINILFILLSLFFGWYSKMDFLWFTFGFILAIFIFFHKYLINRLKSVNRFLIKIYIFSILIFILFCIYWTIKKNIFNIFSIDGQHILRIINTGYDVLVGGSFLKIVYGQNNLNLNVIYFIIISILIFVSVLLLFKKKVEYKRQVAFIWAIQLCIVFQICLVKISGAPWHLLYLYPFIQILLAYPLCKLFTKKTFFIAILLNTLLIGCQLYTYFRTINAFSYGIADYRWSTGIYKLIEYTKKSSEKFISTDWGMGTQLLTFDYTRNKYYNYWPSFLEKVLSESNSQFLFKKFYENKDYVFITYPEHFSSFPQTKINMMEIARRNNIKLKKIKEITENNKIIFELYKPE